MSEKEYISVAEMAQILGISRVAVHKRIKKGRLAAIRIGRSHAIPVQYLHEITGSGLSEKTRELVNEAVIRTVEQYEDTLRLFGDE